MAAEIGILGLAIFLWFVFKLFRLGIYAVRETNDSLLLGLLAALLAFLTQSFFDVNLYALQLVTLFWFILGLTMARINILTINKDART
jgi:O-antigen ligase